MAHFTKEQLHAARQANLYEYLMLYHPGQFQREGKSIRPVDNHSLSIKQGYKGFQDFATMEHGNSVDFLVNYMGYSITEAVIALSEFGGMYISAAEHINVTAPDINLPLKFPDPADGGYKQMYAFLLKRGIPPDIIRMLVEKKLLYQSKEKNNCVFINQERDWGELRGTYTYGSKPFHGSVPGCRYDGYWALSVMSEASVAYICEAAIDAISLYVLHNTGHHQREPTTYISIGGVAKQRTIDRIRNTFPTVILAVDNDDAGQACRERNPELQYIIPVHKDWNEDLLSKKLQFD
ncbi:MAG: DUF3991 and toprim domain-containing protein [Lachnospiraceae bacterium]|nr:DUF3991 and toprim domain-containing protein [Lachnospiraceae bacterium]